MKIAVIITELHEGGAENALWQVAKGLVASGEHVSVACLFGGEGPVAERLRGSGIQVADLGLTGLAGVFRVARLREWLAAERPDVVHSWLFRANLFARLARLNGVPLVCGLRVVEQRKWQILTDRLTSGRVDCYACVSTAVQDFAMGALNVPKSRCVVIENGVDFDAFSTARNQHRMYEKVRGLTVARVTEQKGLDILLKGLAELPKEMAWSWTFVGARPSGSYQESLADLAADLKIDDRIQWIGAVPREKIASYYAAANCFALPSRWEGQPNVVLEAMASGLPTLSSRTDGIDDLLESAGDCLEVIEPNAPEAWATALSDLWGNTSGFSGLAERGAGFAELRGWGSVVVAYRSMYDSLLEGGS